MLRKPLIKPALNVSLLPDLAVKLNEHNEEYVSGGTAARLVQLPAKLLRCR